jgi:CHAD domain-containing protein
MEYIRMTYQFEPDEAVDTGLRRIAKELIDDAIAWSEKPDADLHEAVHEVRKDCKKIRGLLRIVRPAAPKLYAAENAAFRDAAASLSFIRDIEASIESHDALMARFEDEMDQESLAPIRAALSGYKHHVSETAGDLEGRLAEFRMAMLDARERVETWKLPKKRQKGDGWQLLEAGLSKTYQRGRRAMAAAYDAPSVEAFHDWRKRAKYLRYHIRLLRPAWPQLLRQTHEEVKTLGELLGDDHDLAVLREVLPLALESVPDPQQTPSIQALIERRSLELRGQAHWLGLRIYAEPQKAMRKRMHAYWSAAWREQRRSAQA